MLKRICIVALLPLVLLGSCQRKGATGDNEYPLGDDNEYPLGVDNEYPLVADNEYPAADYNEYPDTVEIRYARGLRVAYGSDGIHVIISDPDPEARHAARGQEFVVKRPSRRVICTTALQLGNFEVLRLEQCIVGINSLKSLFSPAIKEQLRQGHTVEIGREGEFDIEAVIASKPDYILVSASKHGGFDVLRQCGIPLIPHHGYKETDPLGQAEWIKLVGILTGETRRANAVFDRIERQYLSLKRRVARAVDPDNLPTVASGRQVREGWYVVGGRSYMANIFSDAGARYVMADNRASGGVTMDFEAAYAKSVGAEFWQIDGRYKGQYSLQALAAEDPRYATMHAYKKGTVLFCNLTQTPYRELAAVEPHLLLADFVRAFHPEILPDYNPKYYKPIN
ncbi:MAG: ABC transporter substrate-binding protein [Prevotellaceae bacterium]|nr:ABC transporter substrate-binding protein [Prevotellaceae bacterium]